MRCFQFFVLLGLLVLLSVGSAFGQECGDINGDGGVNIADMTYFISWLQFAGPEPNQSTADVDGRAGLTIADVTYFQRYLFGIPIAGPAPNCSGAGSYSYAEAGTDTIFLPHVLGIPESVESLTIPIITSMQPNTAGFYFEAVESASESNGVFKFDSVTIQSGGDAGVWFQGTKTYGDTLICLATASLSPSMITGATALFSAHFTRIAPGPGDISFELTDRSETRRSCIAKDDGDLYLPVISYLTASPEFLQAPDDELDFTAVRLFPSNDSYDIDITATGGIINWTAETDADWLTLSSAAGTTPSTLSVTVGELDMSAGNYSGTISIRNADDVYGFDQGIDIVVNLSMTSPHPSMDANCDGKLNISDLTYLVNYLYGIPLGPAPCDPCTGLFPDE